MLLVEHVVIAPDGQDTFCLLPSSMRCLCLLLTLLLITSLAAAIFNSLQSASAGSASFCKPPEAPFHPSVLCPKESMFLYYSCCELNGEKHKCCTRYKVWLLVAMLSVGLSCVVGTCYTLVRYVCLRSCLKR